MSRRFVDLRDGSSGLHRWYARSNNEKAKPDPDVIATEMLKYAASCRKQVAALEALAGLCLRLHQEEPAL